MACVFVCLQICVEDPSESHRIPSVLSHVHRSFQSSSQLQLVGFHWNDLNERHLDNQLFGVLVVQAVLLNVPLRSLEIETLDVASVLKSFLDVFRPLSLGNLGVESGFVQSPLLGSASGLHESSQVRLRDMETTQPDHLWFLVFDPSFVLTVPSVEVLHPVNQIFECHGC